MYVIKKFIFVKRINNRKSRFKLFRRYFNVISRIGKFSYHFYFLLLIYFFLNIDVI